MKYLQKVEDAKRLIAEAIVNYPTICLGCSFGKDSMVALDLVYSVKPDIPVFVIMADTEFPATYDFAAKVVAVIPFVGEECAHRRRERQNIWRRRDIGILAWSQVQNDRPAERIAQRMDFCRAASARAADCLIVFPPFPPEAHR